MKFKSFLPAFLWLLTSFVLLALPGDDLPDNNFFDIPNFDKIVHLGMFFLLTVLFALPVAVSGMVKSRVYFRFYTIALSATIYGITMEVVQKYFVYGRSFDGLDIVFDALGAATGLIAIHFFYHKKIGPDRHRGRNQN